MKKRIVIIFTLILSFTILSCDVLNQSLNLFSCKYELAGLVSPSISGISLTDAKSISNLNAASMLKITSSLMAGKLPFSMTLNVKATNPNTSAAQLAGLDWAVDVENSTLFTGNVANAVSIGANGGQAIIPLNFQIDLMQVLKGDSKDNILSLAQSLLNVGDASSKVSLRIKPSLMVAGQRINAPNFITVYTANTGK